MINLLDIIKKKINRYINKSVQDEIREIVQEEKEKFEKQKESEVIEDNKPDKTIEQVHISNINTQLINELVEYDIVLVKMNKEEIQRQNINTTHQKRPFLIDKKLDDSKKVNGYYFTSNIQNKVYQSQKYKGLKIVLNKELYKLQKNSLISLNQSIQLPYENIIHKIDHLLPRDLNRLKKYRSLLLNCPVISTSDNKLVEISDIISKDDKTYLIYQLDHNNCYGYRILKSSKSIDNSMDFNYVTFDNSSYFVDFNEAKSFSLKQPICIVQRWNDEIVEEIRKNKKNLHYKEKQNKKKSLSSHR